MKAGTVLSKNSVDSYFRVFVCGGVVIHMCACVLVCVDVSTCACDSGVSSHHSSPHLWIQGLSLYRELPVWLAKEVRVLQHLSPSIGVTTVCFHTQMLYLGSGDPNPGLRASIANSRSSVISPQNLNQLFPKCS